MEPTKSASLATSLAILALHFLHALHAYRLTIELSLTPPALVILPTTMTALLSARAAIIAASTVLAVLRAPFANPKTLEPIPVGRTAVA